MKNAQKESVYRRIPRREFLEGAKTRLINDAGTYFDAIDSEAQRGNHVGFFGSIRLLIPAIYGISAVIYKGPEDQRTDKLLCELGIKYPTIIKEMFRHALLHGDAPRSIRYRGRTVSWGVATGQSFHIMKHGQIILDSRKLYHDLLELLERKIQEDKGTYVYLEVALKIRNKASKKFKDEIIQISQ